ncbi:MAG: insulinase family protein [Candidatus Tectomicrobia bacterium]|uniref:Insulinase family protein n=1 Tax=Tectimicrobiota bacterium TaxID=2528274 RepID=A0A932FXZ4_UNCTE|nr:insulinase family protein [Candidatus Tectomicrobia bacterium]
MGAGLRERVVETVLPNGLKVLLLENPKAPLLTFQVWYRVGSRNEEWGKTGLSHLLEHMMFKGTPKVGPDEFSRTVQDHGGDYRAFTFQDFTAYIENLGADQAQVAIELEADRMRNLLLREPEFQTERLVVMEERRLRTEDNLTAFLLEQVQAMAFQTSPYHWPVIGWMPDLARLTREDLQAYYRTYYHPVNAFLVVVGDFQPAELLPKIAQAFGSYPPGTAVDPEKNIDPPQLGERRIIVQKASQVPSLAMGYHVPSLRESDSYVLEVIAAILAAGRSSRLYQRLVQKRPLVLNVGAHHSLLSRDPNLFSLTATLLPGRDVGEVEKALDQEIERLQREPVGQRELEKAQNSLEASFLLAQDSLFQQAMLLARYEVAFGWRAIDQYLSAIRDVTPEAIQRVAQRYLTSKNRTVGTLLPPPRKEGEKSSAGEAE